MIGKPRGSRPRLAVRVTALGSALLAGTLSLTNPAQATPAQATPAMPDSHHGPASSSGCTLGPDGRIQHVIYLTFDNVHLTRDSPNVPGDLEQMPHLLNFLERDGVLLSNNHTPLMSHTGTDLLTASTGLYGDRHGQPISNGYRYYRPDGTTGAASTFTYWTDPLFDPADPSPADTALSMVTEAGRNTPAPWVNYTRAGCSFGAIASSNAVVENVSADIPKIFGPDSPEADQLAADPDRFKDDETTEYGGLIVHCPRGDAMCAQGNRGVPDLLPDEPGGYQGFSMLAGSRYIAPLITDDHGLNVPDILGHTITNPFTHQPGFPGFDGMTAAVSLGYTAALQEHGVPVTYAYISDAHDDHVGNSGSFGPGQAGYEAQLRDYDAAFGAFFDRLATDGITAANTLFVVTADENDHFLGVAKNGCDGVTTPCRYGPGEIGEINTNINGLLATQRGDTVPFGLNTGVAPSFYVNGNPDRTDPAVRRLDRDLLAVTATNPYTGATETVNRYAADRVELRLLHMASADPLRSPTVQVFARPDYFVSAGPVSCASPCVSLNPRFAWNHGSVAPDITTTWLGLVGPGVRRSGVDARTWADHTDIHPTMMSLLGLRDDYPVDGRVLVEDLEHSAVPVPMRAHHADWVALGSAYKQLDASVGQFGLDTLAASTAGLASGGDGSDSRYTATEAALESLGVERDQVAQQIQATLLGAEFDGRHASRAELRLLRASTRAVLDRAHALAAVN